MSRVFWANKSVFWHFHAFDDLQSYWPYLCHPLSTINAHPHSCSCCLCSHPLQPFFCRCSPEPVCSATAFLFFRCLCLLVDAGSCWVYVYSMWLCAVVWIRLSLLRCSQLGANAHPQFSFPIFLPIHCSASVRPFRHTLTYNHIHTSHTPLASICACFFLLHFSKVLRAR